MGVFRSVRPSASGRNLPVTGYDLRGFWFEIKTLTVSV